MQFMMLLYGDEAAFSGLPEDAQEEAFKSFMAYNRELAEAGVLVAGSELLPSRTAVTLRGKKDQIVATDGPFAEAKEQIGGYYILSVDSREQALEWAKKCPSVWGGAIEVRELGTQPEELG
ncbi:MAG: YciI family protein [Sandaracinaceae bacterium]